MSTLQRIEPGPILSHAVIHNGIVYLSGVVSPGKSVREQTKNVLHGIDTLLARAGTDKSRILTATVRLSDIRQFDEMNSVWDKWVVPGHAPARACVEEKLSLLGFAVAIAVTAAQPPQA
jgi:enamine deaminase RidA (YjgF/YER057c/UK114 family)